ncbi:MAG: SPOR domain-containing protein [Rickettsiales bacterium]|nr:SPOR domain-containing protein [Rickettsiales bacterium]
MKTSWFCSFILLFSLVGYAGSGNAAEKYYIELGNAVDDEDAQKDWQVLSSKYSDIIGHLEFLPGTIMDSNNNIKIRIQAGPIDSKKEAQKLCERLFEKEAACFVIEGLVDPMPKKPRKISKKSAPAESEMPWSKESASTEAAQPAISEPKPEDKKESGGLFSGILDFMGSDKESTAVTPVQVQDTDVKKEAKVEVAEAVSVPLSNKRKIEPKATNYYNTIKTEEAPKLIEPSLGKGNHSGWLTVNAFSGEEQATAFWQQVREAAPQVAATLKVTVVYPVIKRKKDTVSLSMGTFSSRADALAFCESTIKKANDSLICSFSEEEAPKAESQVIAARDERADRYAFRRKVNPAPAEASAPTPAPAVVRSFWLEVAAARTQTEALDSWATIQKAQQDIVKDLRGSVLKTGRKGAGKFVVRVGPIENDADAADLCKQLKEKGVNCNVYSNL